MYHQDTSDCSLGHKWVAWTVFRLFFSQIWKRRSICFAQLHYAPVQADIKWIPRRLRVSITVLLTEEHASHTPNVSLSRLTSGWVTASCFNKKYYISCFFLLFLDAPICDGSYGGQWRICVRVIPGVYMNWLGLYKSFRKQRNYHRLFPFSSFSVYG